MKSDLVCKFCKGPADFTIKDAVQTGFWGERYETEGDSYWRIDTCAQEYFHGVQEAVARGFKGDPQVDNHTGETSEIDRSKTDCLCDVLSRREKSPGIHSYSSTG